MVFTGIWVTASLLKSLGLFTVFWPFSIILSFGLSPFIRQLPSQFCIFSFLLIIIRSGILTEIRWSVCMSKSYRNLCMSFSRTVAGLCIYHLLVWSNLKFFHISQWISLSTQSCLLLYSFRANLLHLLIIIIIIIIYSFRVFHVSVIWWLFTGVWVTANFSDSSQYSGRSQ